MVMARLHVICGNCGCNDEWELTIERRAEDIDGDHFADGAYMCCGNCATIHNVKDNAKTVVAEVT